MRTKKHIRGWEESAQHCKIVRMTSVFADLVNNGLRETVTGTIFEVRFFVLQIIVELTVLQISYLNFVCFESFDKYLKLLTVL